MCWNADVSLNTFLFSCLALGFVYYTNTYTKYKTPLFDNPIAYAAFMSFVSMQLVEYFLWRNLKNREWNRVFSRFGLGLLAIQPFLFALLVPSLAVRSLLLYLYFAALFVYITIYAFFTDGFPHAVVKNGHLSWIFSIFLTDGHSTSIRWLIRLLNFMWTSILFYSVYLTGEYVFFTLALISILYLLYKYYNDNTWPSLWCWTVNIYMLWLVFRILIVLPFYEYSGVC